MTARPPWPWWIAASALAALTVAWTLAHPGIPLAVTTVRAVTDIAGVLTLGLAVAPLLEEARYRPQLVVRGAPLLGLAAACWLLSEAVRLTLVTAGAVGQSVSAVSVRTLARFAAATGPGRSALIGLAAAAAVVALVVLVRHRSSVWLAVTIAAAGIGITARAVTGHLAGSMLGGAAVALHALAAALWCGVLGALAALVTSRGQWARVLPEFSRLALWCVAVLLVAGVLAALAVAGSPAGLLELPGTGYGRILLAKLAVTAVLLALAWRNRSGWLAEARGHRITAQRSLRRAGGELALMAAAMTFAAALSVTG